MPPEVPPSFIGEASHLHQCNYNFKYKFFHTAWPPDTSQTISSGTQPQKLISSDARGKTAELIIERDNIHHGTL